MKKTIVFLMLPFPVNFKGHHQTYVSEAIKGTAQYNFPLRHLHCVVQNCKYENKPYVFKHNSTELCLNTYGLYL